MVSLVCWIDGLMDGVVLYVCGMLVDRYSSGRDSDDGEVMMSVIEVV
jgi:hypothetical protein